MCPLNLENVPYINVPVENGFGKQRQETCLSGQNWHRSLILKGVFGKTTCFEPFNAKFPSQVKSYSSYIYRIYKISAGTCSVCKEALERDQIK